MALKFRKRVRIFPGFYLNLSKSGMSATVGMKGMSVNFGKKGTFLNTGIPGTGLYDRVRLDDSSKNRRINDEGKQYSTVPKIYDEAEEIKSYQPELITSEGLFGLKESIINAQKEKEELKQESDNLLFQKGFALFLLICSYCLIFGFFIKWFRENYNLKNDAARKAKEEYLNFKLDIDFNMDEGILNDYITLKNNYEQLITINSIWDITTSKSVNKVKERSAANTSITRIKVNFSKSSLDFINTKYEALKLHNANGGDIFIYPSFIVMLDKWNKGFALIDFREINIEHHGQRFIEKERVPKDTKIIDRTWRYVNKNGSPDRRYNNNYEIPITLYYEVTLETPKGLYECYQFSNPEIGQEFCQSLENYKNSLQKMNWKNDKEE